MVRRVRRAAARGAEGGGQGAPRPPFDGAVPSEEGLPIDEPMEDLRQVRDCGDGEGERKTRTLQLSK